MEVRRVARQHDHAARRIRLELVGLELRADPDVENPRYHGVDPIFRVFVWHELYAGGDLYSHHVGRAGARVAYQYGKPHRRRVGRQGAPLDIFWKDLAERLARQTLSAVHYRGHEQG